MNVRMITRTGLVLAICGLFALVACEAPPPAGHKPGALPNARLDVTPQLNASTYVAHGNLLEQQNALEAAVEQYRKALTLTPDLVAARNRLGIVLNRLGRHDEASAEFRQALMRQPQSAHLHNNLGFSLYLEGQLEDAEAEFARAVDLQPAFRRALMNRGMVLAKLGRFDAALADFKLAGSEVDAYYNLALLQTETGQFAAAARALEQALRIDPQCTAARDQLREIARQAAEVEETRLALSEVEDLVHGHEPVAPAADARLAPAEAKPRYAVCRRTAGAPDVRATPAVPALLPRIAPRTAAVAPR